MNNNGFDWISSKDNTRENLQHLINYYKISLESLSKILEVDSSWLVNYLDGKAYWDELENLHTMTFISTISLLSEGVLNINEDTRIKAVIEGLGFYSGITQETIATYARLELKDVQNFMMDANSISYEKRYKLATASLFLHFLLKKPLKVTSET